MNSALQHMHSDKKLEIFTKEDDVLWTSGYIKTGIRNGWKLLHDKDHILEVECHSLCMVVTILNYTLLQQKFERLTNYEKLYLFFISYLTRDNKKHKDISPDYAIRKLNMKIKYEKVKYEKYLKEYGEEHRRTKQSVKNIKRFGERIKEIIDDGGIIHEKSSIAVKQLYKLDVCNNIDCEFLHKYKMGKKEQDYKTYEKFCNHITFIFKGVVWLNMCFYFGGFKKLSDVSISKQSLPVNINIRKTMSGPLREGILLVPTKKMYGQIELYTKEERERLVTKSGRVNWWVYTNLDKKKKTMEKVEINHLLDKKYIIATLWGEELDIINKNNNTERTAKRIIDDFVNGVGKLPILHKITKTNKTLGGLVKKTLLEDIENTITTHWLVMHRNNIKDYIVESVL